MAAAATALSNILLVTAQILSATARAAAVVRLVFTIIRSRIPRRRAEETADRMAAMAVLPDRAAALEATMAAGQVDHTAVTPRHFTAAAVVAAEVTATTIAAAVVTLAAPVIRASSILEYRHKEGKNEICSFDVRPHDGR